MKYMKYVQQCNLILRPEINEMTIEICELWFIEVFVCIFIAIFCFPYNYFILWDGGGGGGGFKEFPGTVGHLSEHSEVYFYSSLTKSGLILPLVGQSYICEISALWNYRNRRLHGYKNIKQGRPKVVTHVLI